MFCKECICHKCPYGLKCYICDRELDGHLLICDGCSGDRVTEACTLDHIAPKHASALREIIKVQDAEAMKAYFDYKTGAWYNEISC